MLAGIAAIKKALVSSSSAPALITFQPARAHPYGFDAQAYEVHAANYEMLMVQKKPYPVSWMSVATGKSATVVAHAEESNVFPDHVHVEVNGSPVTPVAMDSVQRQLRLTGQGHEQEQAVVVYQGEGEAQTVTGKLNVISYEEVKKQLIIVPVNNTPVPDALLLQTQLNQVYQQAVVQWQVSVDKTLKVSEEMLAAIDEVPSGLLSNYPKKMQQLIQAYRKRRDADKEAYYLFLVEKSTSARTGFMPKKRPYGFVFTAHQTEHQMVKTIAHELGHGAFRLEHTFQTYPSLSQGSTENLMDYGNGTRLRKYQWDLIHDPVKMLGWFQQEEEGASYDYCEVIFKEKLATIHQANLEKKEEVNFYWSGEGQHCELWDVQIGSSLLDVVEFSMPIHGNIQFHPLKYKRKETQKLGDLEGEFIQYQFGDFEFEDDPVVTLSITVMKEQSNALEEYLFSNKRLVETTENKKPEGRTSKENAINGAINAMKAYLGNTYEQESGALRTENSEKALKKMDCSELVSRYLQKLPGVEKVPKYTTVEFSAFIDKPNSFVEYINKSDRKDFKEILPGDIFLWREDTGGHTGVVISYDEATDRVTVMEAISSRGSSEENLSKSLDGYCKGCVRISVYSRTGRALQKHDGWKGYFRPKLIINE